MQDAKTGHMMHRAIQLSVLLGFLITARTSSADLVAYICRNAENSPNLLPLKNVAGCWEFSVKTSDGKTVSSKLKFRGSGAWVASKDGRSVVFIQDWPYAGITDDGRIVDFGAEEKGKKAVGLVFFRDGHEVASYTLDDILKRSHLLGPTASHVRWLVNANKVFEEPIGKHLEIITQSRRVLKFDVQTGKLLSEDDTPFWKSCDVIVCTLGVLDDVGPGKVAMRFPYFMKPHKDFKAPLVMLGNVSKEIRAMRESLFCLEITKGGLAIKKAMNGAGFCECNSDVCKGWKD